MKNQTEFPFISYANVHGDYGSLIEGTCSYQFSTQYDPHYETELGLWLKIDLNARYVLVIDPNASSKEVIEREVYTVFHPLRDEHGKVGFDFNDTFFNIEEILQESSRPMKKERREYLKTTVHTTDQSASSNGGNYEKGLSKIILNGEFVGYKYWTSYEEGICGISGSYGSLKVVEYYDSWMFVGNVYSDAFREIDVELGKHQEISDRLYNGRKMEEILRAAKSIIERRENIKKT